jgi:hypothetical protein
VGLGGESARVRKFLSSKIGFREVNRAKNMAPARSGAVGDDLLEQRHGFGDPTQA